MTSSIKFVRTASLFSESVENDFLTRVCSMPLSVCVFILSIPVGDQIRLTLKRRVDLLQLELRLAVDFGLQVAPRAHVSVLALFVSRFALAAVRFHLRLRLVLGLLQAFLLSLPRRIHLNNFYFSGG